MCAFAAVLADAKVNFAASNLPLQLQKKKKKAERKFCSYKINSANSRVDRQRISNRLQNIRVCAQVSVNDRIADDRLDSFIAV